jgi:RNA polymerase sigma factor (sigma-70 family)
MAQAALERLTPVERAVIVALYAKGYSQIEVSERLGYSRRHVSRLHRSALQKMQTVWVS